jgi:hypothetical protein
VSEIIEVNGTEVILEQVTEVDVVDTSPKVDSLNGVVSGLTINNAITMQVANLSGTTPVLSPENGAIQLWTLTGNSAPTIGAWGHGQSLTMMIDDGANYTINWPAITWLTEANTAPILEPVGYSLVALWKIGSVIYGRW